LGEVLEVVQYTSPKFKVLYPEYSKGKKYLVFKGGRASTKSWSIAKAIIDHCCTYDGLRVVCGREIMKSIDDSSKKLLEDTIQRAGKTDDFKVTNSYIENVHTGATIKFMGVRDNPKSIKGLEGVDIFWGDEADSFSEESLDIICPTMRKKGCKVIFSYNPQLPTTPIEKLQVDKADRCVVVFINYLEVLSFLPPDLIAEAEECREKEPEKYRWIWLGEYRMQSQATFIPLKFVSDGWRKPPVRTDEGVVAGLDIGLFHDRCVMVIRQGLNLLYGREWKNVDNKLLTSQVVGLVAKWGVQRLGIDSVGQGYPVYQDLRGELGEVAVALNTGVEARNKKKFVRLRDEMWGMEKDWFDAGGTLNGVGRYEDWTTDLTNIEYFYDNKGRYTIESKRHYIGRGFPSTDWADALGHSLLVKPLRKASEFSVPEKGGDLLLTRERYGGDYPCDWMGI
jgi:phage terminase large subunit